MTVESTLRKVTYEGNGAATSFPVPFAYSQVEDLRLIFTDAAGADTAVTTNFEIAVENGGTSVIFPLSGAPIASGTSLTIFRETPQTQIVGLEAGGAFDPGVLENDGFDRIVMMVQEVQETVDRSVTVPITSETTPEDLMQDLFDASESAAESAAQAAASADNAQQSAANAKASETLAAAARDRSCQCADRAEAARDVALQQTETVNGLMATELAKINAIVGTNRDDQQAAVDLARRWAEEEPGAPVDVDADGNARYSARHWAQEAEEISIPIMSDSVRGAARLGAGLEITDGDKLNVVFPLATTERAGMVRFALDSELTLESTAMVPNAAQLASLYFRAAALEASFATQQQVLHVRDEKAYNVSGGTFTAGSWRQRDLNTVVTNTIPGATLSDNKITLPVGRYHIEARSPGYYVNRHVVMLSIGIDTSPIAMGSSAYTQASDQSTQSDSFIRSLVSFENPVTFALFHQGAVTHAGNGFGIAHLFAPHNNIYSEVFIRRIA